jgi:hypothetical protein
MQRVDAVEKGLRTSPNSDPLIPWITALEAAMICLIIPCSSAPTLSNNTKDYERLTFRVGTSDCNFHCCHGRVRPMMAKYRVWKCFATVALGIALGPIVFQSGAVQAEQAQASSDLDATGSRLIAAAEPFEALTEQAFSAQPKKLDRNIAAAEKAVDQARSALSSDVASELDERLMEIRSARKSNDRSRLALASVEAYRLLVTAAPQTKVPTAVSLLDYAGFPL